MSKKVLVILGHSLSDSLCGALSAQYAEAAAAAGHQVQVLKLGELQFDPILRQGFRQIQPLEADLQHAQKQIAWAEHIALVYPIWWGAAPALLKGFIDRVFLPGFAFKYDENSSFQVKLLAGRSAHLMATMDTPPWYYRWVYRLSVLKQMRKTTLEFCGIKVKKSAVFGPVISAKAAQKTAWLNQAQALAASI
ncbi:NAD(P)H-dependent oxidoreductase [Chitinibacter sp. SCUT-21]|uniref:NAD(P)H-dependent oxidoreductase n=1 Tax=Chitinibacter sp. SCUT-21 TaxID=2970891 RepID=UPI0035A6AC67